MDTDINLLQQLPELEVTAPGAHAAASCGLTCPVWTSDSLPSLCCTD
ncbi:hypothetical protein [Micromonospora sp. CNB394]|nr:hypothetical protein [Micromonospora sp. CNB394]